MPDIDAVRVAAREAVSELVGERIEDDRALISSGLIDSLSVLTLISKIEKKLSLRLATGSLQPDDFDNIELITDTVIRATV
jgi:acyl carrier protein